jgi:F-type H+-transporting ATPase subunit delta
MSDNGEREQVPANISNQRVAQVYAEALLEAASRQNATDQVRDELRDLIRSVAGADPAVQTFLLGGIVGRKRRTEILRHAFEGRVHPLLLNFLLVLNDHQRLELLRPILAVYEDLLEKRAGQIRIYVWTAVPLPDDQRQRLLEQLRQATRQEPILQTAVDPNLLGGIVVQVGDLRYDASVRHQLETVLNQLIERSSHAIEVGRDRFSSGQ